MKNLWIIFFAVFCSAWEEVPITNSWTNTGPSLNCGGYSILPCTSNTMTFQMTMPTSRLYNAIRIYMELQVWTPGLNTFQITLNGVVITSLDSQKSASVNCAAYSNYLNVIDYSDTFSDTNLVLTISGLAPVTNLFGISNFILQVNYLAPNCISTFINPFDLSRCDRCADPYILSNNRCTCPYYLVYTSTTENCVSYCAAGMYADSNRVCQTGSQTLLISDLTAPTFTSYQLTYIPDAQYSSPGQKIMTIDGSSVFGPFQYNDAITQNINLAPMSFMMSFRLYILGNIDIYEGLIFFINGYQFFQVANFYSYYMFSSTDTHIGSPQSCTAIGFSCQYLDIMIYYTTTVAITSVKIQGKFNVFDSSKGWGIRDLQISQYSLSPTPVSFCVSPCATCSIMNTYCTSCVVGYNLYDTQCLATCPTFYQASSQVCVSAMLPTQQQLEKKLYDNNQFVYSSGISQFPLVSYFVNNRRMDYYPFPWTYSQQSAPHWQVNIEFKFVSFDCGASCAPLISLVSNANNLILNNATPLTQIQNVNLAQGTNVDPIYKYSNSFAHSNSMIIIQLSINGNVALYDVGIYIDLCPPGCQQCSSSTVCTGLTTSVVVSTNNDRPECAIQPLIPGDPCISCATGYTMFNGQCYCSSILLFEASQFCLKFNKCHKSCLTCHGYNYDTCLSCNLSAFRWLSINKCVCINGYYEDVDIKCQLCHPTCKTCSYSARSCSSCNAAQHRALNWDQCECQDGYFQEYYNYVCSQCSPYCATCVSTSTTCTSCVNTRSLNGTVCQCSEGYYDIGLITCAQCQQPCYGCTQGSYCTSCLASQYRVLSSQGGQCICMAGYFAVASVATCSSCHFSCQQCNNSPLISQCTNCPTSRKPSSSTLIFTCICRPGYYEVGTTQCASCAYYINPPVTNYCYTKCGDGVVQWNEECDNTSRSCINCQLAGSPCLDSSCLACFAGQCSVCADGYFLLNGKCYVCDPMCQTCQTTSTQCIKCTITNPDGTCLQCIASRGYKIVGNTCTSICGDGILTSTEQCDIGNQTVGGGCYNCLVEPGWRCTNTCVKIIYPSINMLESTIQNPNLNIRTVMVSVDQPVSYQGTLANNVNFTVLNANSSYTLQYKDLTDYSKTYVNLMIQVTINLNIGCIPILSVSFSKNYLNEQGDTFQNSTAQLTLQSYNSPSQSEIAATEGLMNFSTYILYLMFGLAILAFLFGGLEIFWNLLDILQLISYLQYINVNYPYNLQNYFTVFSFAQMNFFEQWFNVQDFVENYVTAPVGDPAIANQGVSSIFIVNIVSIIGAYGIVFGTFFGCYLLFNLISKIMNSLTKEQIDQYDNNIIQFFIFRTLRNVQLQLLQATFEFKSAIVRTFMASAYDLNMAIFLQITNLVFNQPLLVFCGLLAFIVSGVQIWFLYFIYTKMTQPKYYFQLKQTEYQIGALYEGISFQRRINYHYNLILILKKILFMALLCMFYDSPCIQIGLISLLNLFFATYLYMSKPLEEPNEYFKTIICELFLWIAELCILMIAMDQDYDFTSATNCGWAVMSICSLLIVFQLIIDVKQHALYLTKEYNVLKKLFERLQRYFKNRDHVELEQGIFLAKKKKKLDQLRKRKVVTFSLSQ